MAQDIEASLRALRFPYRIVYGPERLARDRFDPVIVVERDREQSDAVVGNHGQDRNPRLTLQRNLAVKATIYARSSLPGARANDHERECEQVVDAFLVALRDWQVEARAGSLDVVDARYLQTPELEQWPGVAYVLRFRVPRGVRKLDYVGAALPTAAVQGIIGEVRVRRNGDDTPEIVPIGSAPEEPEDP